MSASSREPERGIISHFLRAYANVWSTGAIRIDRVQYRFEGRNVPMTFEIITLAKPGMINTLQLLALLTIPTIANASVELSFSALKKIQNCLPTKQTQERLTKLLLLAREDDFSRLRK